MKRLQGKSIRKIAKELKRDPITKRVAAADTIIRVRKQRLAKNSINVMPSTAIHFAPTAAGVLRTVKTTKKLQTAQQTALLL